MKIRNIIIIYIMSEKLFVNGLLKMTVPELQNELNMKVHTVVEQMILRDLIRRRVEEEYTCQANKNFSVKFRPYRQSCIQGIPLTYPKGADLSKYCLRATPDSCPLNVVSASVNPYLIDKSAKNVIIKDNENTPTFCLSDFKQTTCSNGTKSSPYLGTQAKLVSPTLNENELLSSRFFDDILAIKQTHKDNNFGEIVF
jgi:hypothetical protein